MKSHRAYLGLGSNIETPTSTRYDYLSFAVRQLSQHEKIKVLKASNVFETLPVGFCDQDNFYNAVIEIETTLTAQELLRVCLDVVEKRAGRIRTVKDGPRTLDVDLLLFDDETITEADLEVPHPRMNERAFVIVPLSKIAPEKVKPIDEYDFVDSIEGVVELDLNFDSIIDSYKETD